MADNTYAAGTLGADPGYAALAPELQGAFKNKGWDAKTPFEAAVESFKSYTEVEKHLGIPRDQLLRVPKDAADVDGWKAVNARLGVPAKPEEYDLSKVTFKDGTELDDSFSNTIKAAMHAEGVPASRAPALVSAIVKYMDGVEETETAQLQAKLAEGRDKLNKSWGANAEAFKFIAGQAVLKLGLPKDFVETVEKTVGYEQTMQTLLKIGQAMGEDKLVSNDLGDGKQLLTAEQAQARLAEKKRDSEWVRKVNAGDFQANQEHDALLRVISGVARAA